MKKRKSFAEIMRKRTNTNNDKRKNNDPVAARNAAAERRGWRRMAVDLEREAEQLTSAARLIRRRLSA